MSSTGYLIVVVSKVKAKALVSLFQYVVSRPSPHGRG